jgi:NAD(P)-dependent dehydrogenase (short-subunit alcohol dehydrogenase family)
MSFNRHPGSTHVGGICNHPDTTGEGMNIANKTVLITGANRGIGRALVNEALRRGAERVYAGVRGGLEIADPRVTPLTLDVTNATQIARATEQVGSLDVLVNNAGIALYDDLSNPALTEQHLAVNLYGPLNVTRAFLPLLRRSQGAVVNNLSVAALAPVPVIPSYSISKAAALNMTQALRALLAGKSVSVHAVFLGPIDTDMNRGFDIPKAPTEVAARGIFDGLERGEEDIFPDPMSQSIAEAWRAGAAKALERQFAAFVPQSAAAA